MDPVEKLPDTSLRTKVLAVLVDAFCVFLILEISMVLSFKIAVILPAVWVKSISVLSVDDIAIFASACASADEKY